MQSVQGIWIHQISLAHDARYIILLSRYNISLAAADDYVYHGIFAGRCTVGLDLNWWVDE